MPHPEAEFDTKWTRSSMSSLMGQLYNQNNTQNNKMGVQTLLGSPSVDETRRLPIRRTQRSPPIVA